MEDRLRECPFCGHGVMGETESFAFIHHSDECFFSSWTEIIKQDDAQIRRWNTRATDPRCKCAMRTRLVGDGCRYCNPQHYIDMLEEQINQTATNPLIDEIAKKIADHYEKDRLMEEMARALATLCQKSINFGYDFALNNEINQGRKALQKYQEMKDAK